jgi:hypothetical protein
MLRSSYGATQHMASFRGNAIFPDDDQNDMRKFYANAVDAKTKRRMFQASELIRFIRGGMMGDRRFNGLAS